MKNKKEISYVDSLSHLCICVCRPPIRGSPSLFSFLYANLITSITKCPRRSFAGVPVRAGRTPELGHICETTPKK